MTIGEEIGAKQAAEEAVQELRRASAAFPSFASAYEGYAVLLKHVDDLWDEVKNKYHAKDTTARMREEAIQVAAMALRFIVDVCE